MTFSPGSLPQVGQGHQVLRRHGGLICEKSRSGIIPHRFTALIPARRYLRHWLQMRGYLRVRSTPRNRGSVTQFTLPSAISG